MYKLGCQMSLSVPVRLAMLFIERGRCLGCLFGAKKPSDVS